MNPSDYDVAPEVLAPVCPACGARPAWKPRLTFSQPYPVVRMACSRCRTRTKEFSTWVGALAAWDRFDVLPKRVP